MSVARDFRIRQAKPSDASFLPEIEKSAGKAFKSVPGLEWVADEEVWSAEDHRDWMKRAAIWVAENEEQQLCAFLIAERFDPELHIWEVAVSVDEQGAGLGRRLLGTAETHARKEGLRTITLTTFRDLKFNESFYTGLGFRRLNSDAVSKRLQRALDNEAAEGLPIEKRCAMMKTL